MTQAAIKRKLKREPVLLPQFGRLTTLARVWPGREQGYAQTQLTVGLFEFTLFYHLQFGPVFSRHRGEKTRRCRLSVYKKQ